jgi:hypothetical protein
LVIFPFAPPTDQTSDSNSSGFSARSRNIRGKAKFALHPLDDRRQCYAGRAPISFAKPDTLYSPIRVETRVWRLPLHDDANETCTLGISLLDLVIAACKRSRETEPRFSDDFFRYQAKTASRPGKI